MIKLCVVGSSNMPGNQEPGTMLPGSCQPCSASTEHPRWLGNQSWGGPSVILCSTLLYLQSYPPSYGRVLIPRKLFGRRKTEGGQCSPSTSKVSDVGDKRKVWWMERKANRGGATSHRYPNLAGRGSVASYCIDLTGLVSTNPTSTKLICSSQGQGSSWQG